MELGRIVLLLQGEQHALVRRTWMTKIFVVGDILSFVMQGIGKKPSTTTQALST
jgi:hypothetical protein